MWTNISMFVQKVGRHWYFRNHDSGISNKTHMGSSERDGRKDGVPHQSMDSGTIFFKTTPHWQLIYNKKYWIYPTMMQSDLKLVHHHDWVCSQESSNSSCCGSYSLNPGNVRWYPSDAVKSSPSGGFWGLVLPSSWNPTGCPSEIPGWYTLW